MATYATQIGPTLADPERLAYAIKAMLPFWGDKTCDAVRGQTCRAYAAKRGVSGSTVRRELGALQAALNYAHAEGRLLYPPKVTLPDSSPPRDRWLTRSDAAKVLRELRRGRNKTAALLFLICIYTGTRPGAVMRLRWNASLDSGWIDLAAGVLHRAGRLERQTKKRRASCRIPRQLLGHLRRASRDGREYVVEWRGKPIRDVGVAFDGACARSKVARFTPHTLKHTAITWAFQRGMTMEDAADFFSTTAATLASVYRQHSTEHQSRAVGVMERK